MPAWRSLYLLHMRCSSFRHEFFRADLVKGHLQQGISPIFITESTIPLPKAVCSTMSPLVKVDGN